MTLGSSVVKGYILLEGGAEFGGQMAEPDRRAIDLAGGPDAPVGIIPAAAAPDNNHERAGRNGVRWFKRLGAAKTTVVPLIDRVSANQPSVAATLRHMRLIYLLGGFPHYLARTLSGSLSWESIMEAYLGGAVIAGSSAGAMVLCQHYYHSGPGKIMEGLHLLPKACVIPHYNTFGQGWLPHLQALLPEDTIIGIDEQTGMIDGGGHGEWKVYGKGSVTRCQAGKTKAYGPAQAFSL